MRLRLKPWTILRNSAQWSQQSNMNERTHMHRRITSAEGRRMAHARWDRYHASTPEQEPSLRRWHPLEMGVRDKISGEVAWTDFISVRDAARRLAVVQREYVPGIASRR